MRRILSGLIVLIVVFSLCSCSTKPLTIEQSKKNFVYYEKELKNVVEKYGLELKEVEDDSDCILEYDSDYDLDSESLEETFSVKPNNAEIEITLKNDSIGSNSGGREFFYIDYKIYHTKNKNHFDLDLFTELANCISGKELTKVLCKEFLDAPEEKYAADKYGYTKAHSDIIAKQHPMNFFEDWWIEYYSYTKDAEIISFYGLTKQLTD